MGFLITVIFILKDTNCSFFISEINKRLHTILNCTPKQLSIENKTIFLFKTGFPWLLIKLLRDIARFEGKLVRGHPCALCDPNFYSYGNALWGVEKGEGIRGRRPSWSGFGPLFKYCYVLYTT